MAPKIFAIEFGLGTDLHGQDITKAAIKAVRNAVEHVSLPGMRKVGGVTDLNSQVLVEILVGVPSGFEDGVDSGEWPVLYPSARRTSRW